MTRWAFYNNDFIPEKDCLVPAGDLAIQRGYGVFDFLKSIGGKPVFLDAHLARFYQSAAGLRLAPGKTPPALKAILATLLQKNDLPDSGIRLTLTGGLSADGFSPHAPNLIITQQPLALPSQPLFEKGIHLATFAHQRQMPELKTIDYLMAIWLQPWLSENGADDVLYFQDGTISECPRANFFMVMEDGKICTPDKHILKGITRGKIIEFAQAQVEERTIRRTELASAREAFITSTTKQVLPVTTIDAKPVGDGKPGPVTRRLAHQLAAAIKAQTA